MTKKSRPKITNTYEMREYDAERQKELEQLDKENENEIEEEIKRGKKQARKSLKQFSDPDLLFGTINFQKLWNFSTS